MLTISLLTALLRIQGKPTTMTPWLGPNPLHNWPITEGQRPKRGGKRKGGRERSPTGGGPKACRG